MTQALTIDQKKAGRIHLSPLTKVWEPVHAG